MRLYVTPASPWVRRVMVTILELGIRDRFEFVQTKWPHAWGTRTVVPHPEFMGDTPVARIPTLVTADFTLADSHSICDYLNGEFGNFRLLARDGAARWRALATISIANAIIEAQISRRAELLRSEHERSNDFIDKMRDRQLRCYEALEKQVSAFGAEFDLAQITTAVACGYDDWRYGSDWRDVAPKLAAWFDAVSPRPSLRTTQPAETPQA
ncbi:MAG: glutathione S-transferase family protein [Reyranella sp.]|nr:glutathione S-transferase family protein [Reyranella sp.]MDP3162903.1 glutathione S-transferase family protein [Reyranella sp.]